VRKLLLIALAGCGGDGGDGGYSAALFVPAADLELVYSPTDALALDTGATAPPAAATVTLRVVDGGWELRDGEDWDAGAVRGDFAVDTADGLRVDDTLLLPAFFSSGTTADGLTVGSVGPATVYYGTFDPAAPVDVADGRWAGAQVLAQDFGPVRFTLDGQSWDLVTYDPVSE
jgi:hypothetical protein